VADLFTLAGSYSTSPAVGSPSGVASIPAPIDEELILTAKHYDTIQLTVEGPVAINFGGVTNAHVVILKVTGQKVRARFTSADGALAPQPVDSFHVNMSRTVPITAIDLTRTPGAYTTVDVFLGQITP
jgi:hypothetical protein